VKIAVYTIVKNEEKFIARWAESCKDADIRLIVDTGSTDSTVEVARANGCDVASISIQPWRFDDARNAALALLPSDVDWCVSLDADEILLPGWRQHLESLPENATRPRYKYVWSWNDVGSEGLVFYRDHIHRRHNYRWKHPVHEVLVCLGQEVQSVCGLEVHHHPDSTKSRGQYLPLLELAVKEDPEGDRNLFYLGRELMFYGKNEEAVPHFLKHLEVSKWDAERSASMRYLARVTDRKEHWLLKACAEAPQRREAWVDLAKFYYETRNWLQCHASAERALSITQKPLDYICEADAWGDLPHDLASISLWNLGDKDASVEHAIKALAIKPADSRLRNNVSSIMRSHRKTLVDVIIPSKTNSGGLLNVYEQISSDPAVGNIHVVADGNEAHQKIQNLNLSLARISWVPEGIGIHVMWNQALEQVEARHHVLFLNDDVNLDNLAISTLASHLDFDSSIGLICPNYDGRIISGIDQNVQGANGWYGKTGISGATMMLHADLVPEWKFDERLNWYFGDDDLALWTLITKNRRTVVSSLTSSWGNESWTTKNNPPSGFDALTKSDKKVFDEKWASYASSRT